MESARFIEAMRRLASAVSVVATDTAEHGRVGVTVSSLCSLSADPPSVLVCIYETSAAARAIVSVGRFCANVLSVEQQQVADCFAGRVPALRERRFDCAEWDTLQTGAPVLRNAAVSLDCRLADSHAFGTHRILIGRVVAVRVGAVSPLVYLDREYRRLRCEDSV